MLLWKNGPSAAKPLGPLVVLFQFINYFYTAGRKTGIKMGHPSGMYI
jgi:hypothetical protein